MSVFSSLVEIRPLGIWPGMLGRVVQGKEMTMAIVELAPGSVAARHDHPNEQLGIVLKGSMTFTIVDEKRTLVAGDTYNIQSHVAHEAVAGPDGAVVIDVFAPIRADWRRFEPGEVQKPVWP